MPVYFFDIDVGSGRVLDTEGSSLPDVAAAQREATEPLAQIGTERFPGCDDQTLSVDVRDENGEVVLELSLTLCVWPAEALL